APPLLAALSLHDALPISRSGRVGGELGERRHVAQREIEALTRDRVKRHGRVADEHDAARTERAAAQPAQRMQVAPADLADAAEPDRKSTRLNSSHVKISY